MAHGMTGKVNNPKGSFTSTRNPAFSRLTHPRRCQAKLSGGRICGQWALIGISYCKFHGGAAVKRAREKRNVDDPRTNDVARLRKYKRLGKTLETFVSDLLQQPESEQLELFEELALARKLVDDASAMMGCALDLPEGNETQRSKKLALIVESAQLLRGANDDVRVMSKTAAEIFAVAKDKFSVHALNDIVQQIKRIVHNCFGHCEVEIDEFEKQIRLLQLPKTGVDGTMITPDMDVLAMDGCIPSEQPTQFSVNDADDLHPNKTTLIEVVPQ